MEQKRKMKCFECDGYYAFKEIEDEGLKFKAYVCGKCNDIVLDIAQSKQYLEKMRLKEAVEKERKIIRIGSSMGITLPDMLKKFGVKVGRKVKLEAIDRKSIKITLI